MKTKKNESVKSEERRRGWDKRVAHRRAREKRVVSQLDKGEMSGVIVEVL